MIIIGQFSPFSLSRAAKRKSKKEARQQDKETKALKKNLPVVAAESKDDELLDDNSSNDSGLEDVELEGKQRRFSLKILTL